MILTSASADSKDYLMKRLIILNSKAIINEFFRGWNLYFFLQYFVGKNYL